MEGILVTGATGHLGSFLIEGLSSIKHAPDIRCLIRKTSETEFIEQHNVQLIVGDLEQRDSLYPAKSLGLSSLRIETNARLRLSAMEGVDCLIHLAGMQFYKNILDVCIANEVRRIILIGSAHIYSKVDKAKARMLMEANETVTEYSHKYDLQTTIFQPTMIYGSSRDRNISKIINIIRKYHILSVFGDGKCLRQPVHVRDVVSAIIASIDSPESFGKIYDIGDSFPLSYNEMVQIIAKELQTSLQLVHVPIGIALSLLKVCKPLRRVLTKELILRFAEDRVVNIQPAIKDLNYQPCSFEEGVKLQIQTKKIRS